MAAKERPFLATLPGILTGIAGLLTALVAAGTLAATQGWIGGDGGSDSPSGPAGATTTSAPDTRPSFRVEPPTVRLGGLGGSTQATLTVHNEGEVPIEVAPPRLSGDDPDRFDVTTGDCSAEVAPGESCRIVVRFAEQPGSWSATLVVRVEGARSVEVPVEGRLL